MNVNISKSWRSILKEEFESEYFRTLLDYIETEYKTETCFPERDNIFAAFNHCPYEKVKIVIIGQDPYHGKGQANGLSFSVQEGIKHPPSLINIFKELNSDIGKPYPDSGDLNAWAAQGILLLNATLTVRSGEAGSHQKKGWEIFTDAVIQKLSDEKKNLVFLLWGGFAQKKGRKIDAVKHKVLCTGHPSPLSANRGYWFGNQHFSSVNQYLSEMKSEAIIW